MNDNSKSRPGLSRSGLALGSIAEGTLPHRRDGTGSRGGLPGCQGLAQPKTVLCNQGQEKPSLKLSSPT